MVQIEVLSGKMAGATLAARRFPVRVGRSPGADLCLEDDGVWPEHLEVALEPEGFAAIAHPPASVIVNGQPVERAALREGDLIELGSVRIRFWLAPVRQVPLWTRHLIPWAVLAVVTVGQIALMEWLWR